MPETISPGRLPKAGGKRRRNAESLAASELSSRRDERSALIKGAASEVVRIAMASDPVAARVILAAYFNLLRAASESESTSSSRTEGLCS